MPKRTLLASFIWFFLFYFKSSIRLLNTFLHLTSGYYWVEAICSGTELLHVRLCVSYYVIVFGFDSDFKSLMYWLHVSMNMHFNFLALLTTWWSWLFLLPQHVSNGIDTVKRIVQERGIDGVHGPLIENFQCDKQFFTAVEVTAGNK